MSRGDREDMSERARRLLHDDTFKNALEAVRERAVKALETTPADQPDTILELVGDLRATARFRQAIVQQISTSKIESEGGS